MLDPQLFKALKVLKSNVIDHAKSLEMVNPEPVQELRGLAKQLKGYRKFILIQKWTVREFNLPKSLKDFTRGSQPLCL